MEKINNIPNGWKEYRLEEVAKYINGRAFKPSEWETAGKPIIRIQNLTNSSDKINYSSKEFESKYLVKKGDLLYAWSASLGAHIWKGEDGWLNQHIFKVIPNSNIDKKFLYYALIQITNTLYAKTHGSGMVHVTLKPFLNTKIIVPKSLAEQSSIVSRIESSFSRLDSGIAALQKVQKQLAVYRQAVLKEAFEGCGENVKIIEYFDVSGGLTKNSKRESLMLKMPYLRVANVYYNRLDLSEIKEIGVLESEINDKLLKKDDLLFVEGNGSKEQIGRVAIWDGSVENCLHQNHIIKGRPLGAIRSKYALYYLISDFGRKQILNVSSSTSGLYTLSTEKVRNLTIPYCAIAEQNRIVEQIESRLSVCDSIEKTVTESLRQAEVLRQSILKEAFEGRL